MKGLSSSTWDWLAVQQVKCCCTSEWMLYLGLCRPSIWFGFTAACGLPAIWYKPYKSRGLPLYMVERQAPVWSGGRGKGISEALWICFALLTTEIRDFSYKRMGDLNGKGETLWNSYKKDSLILLLSTYHKYLKVESWGHICIPLVIAVLVTIVMR